MFRNLIAFPLLALVVILQSAVISQMPLLAGYADLMLVILAALALKADAASAWLSSSHSNIITTSGDVYTVIT